MLASLIPPALIGCLTLGGLAFRRFSLRNGRPAADAAIVLAVIAAAGALELGMGRPVRYAHGPVRIWSGDITSDQSSQQIADPYTFTHFVHGALFYGLAWTLMRPASVATRLVAATGVEAAWEVYENTDAVVERYRAETISLGYYGDSLVNSAADIAACIGGFLLTWRLPRAATIAWVATSELMLALWIRDNLALNVLMLVYPIDAIRVWQAAILPGG